MAHSELSASDSGRWSRCPGAVNATRHIKDESSEFAAEGTVAHTVRELCLQFGFDAYSFIGDKFVEDGFTFIVDDEMADNIQPGIDEIREYAGDVYVETWVDTTKWVGLDRFGNRQGGTLDLGVIGEKLIVISDLKYGMGVPVQAVDNDQQVLYAVGFWEQIARHKTKATDFLIIIDQPRNSGGGGYWPITLEKLLERAEKLKAAAAKTKDPDAPLIPGLKQCQWCPIANVPGRIGGCKAHAQWLADAIEMDFDDLDRLDEVGIDWTPPETVTRQQRSHIVRIKSQIEKWLEKLHADELEDLINHGPAFGFKAVRGRAGRRNHRSEQKSLAWMRQRAKKVGKEEKDLETRKTISPAQAEKVLKLGTGNFPNSLVEQGASKPVMVPVADERRAITVIEDEFDDQ